MVRAASVCWANLALENAALRQSLGMYVRPRNRPKLRPTDRALWVIVPTREDLLTHRLGTAPGSAQPVIAGRSFHSAYPQTRTPRKGSKSQRNHWTAAIVSTDLRIALVTDTHVRVEFDDGQCAFESDPRHNERNRTMAAAIQGWQPDLILHLGDVVHPIPSLPTHEQALEVAASIYGNLGAKLVVVPGNHDVGDKGTTANAPALATHGRHIFARHWGPPYQAFDVGEVRLVVVDSTLFGADREPAVEQRRWLEDEFLNDGRRRFVFTHYPPFLYDPNEAEHYDNMSPNARAHFLALLVQARVEALFTGHVHRFFYQRHHDLDIYSLPSAAFTRPEYAHLRSVPPVDPENGRADVEHLGVTLLTIGPREHRLTFQRPLSTFGPAEPSPPSPLGVWLHRKLGASFEVPYGDLDGLARKTARDDARLPQLLQLRPRCIRIPLEDLAEEAVIDRLLWLRRHNVDVMFFSAGVPTPEQLALFGRLPGHETSPRWEIVCRPRDLEVLPSQLAQWRGPELVLSRIGKPLSGARSPYFSHFPRIGFDPADPALAKLLKLAAVAGVAFRIEPGRAVDAQIRAALARVQRTGQSVVGHVELPWGTEATAQEDDDLVAQRCMETHKAAVGHPDVLLLLDQFADKDRGYWCRHGLVTVADQPRPAFVALVQARQALS